MAEREIHVMQSIEMVLFDSSLSIVELEGKRGNIYGINVHKATCSHQEDPVY